MLDTTKNLEDLHVFSSVFIPLKNMASWRTEDKE
jgi:hypothetical protein